MASGTKALKIALIGGGSGCQEFLDLVEQLQGLEVVGVADPDAQAAGIAYASSRGIFTCQDVRQLYGLEGLEVLIELTDSPEVRDTVARTKPAHVALIDHTGARLFIQAVSAQLAACQQALATKSLHEAIFNGVPDEIVIIDRDLRIVEANEAVSKRLGRPREELVGRHCWCLCHGTEAPCEDDGSCPVRQALETGLPSQGLQPAARPGGEPVFHWVMGFPMRDGSGRVSRVVRVAHDITEQKLAEEALRKSEEKYRSLVENIPAVTWTSAQDGRSIFISPNVGKVYGYTPEEIYEDGVDLWLGRIHPDEVESVKRAYEGLFKGGPFDIEYRIQRKDGNWIWIRDRAVATYEKDGVRYAYGMFSDITDRKRAEEALRESERRYRALVDNAIVGVFRTNLKGEILYANQALATMLGYESPEALIGGDVKKRYVRRGRRREFLALLKREGQVYGFEADFKTKQGKPRTLLLSASLQGEVIEGMLIDITERKQAAERLALYKQIIAKSSEAIAIIDPQGHYLEQNAAHCALLGYSDEELRGKTPAVHLGEEVFSAVAREQARSGAWRGELVSRTKEGAPLDIDLSAFAVRDEAGEPVCFVGIKRDISERKRAEEALRESEQKYRALFENMMDAVFVADAETGRLIDVNKAGCALTGRSRQDLVGQPHTILHPPQEADRYAELFRRHVAQGVAISQEDVLIYHASGKLIPSQIAARVVEVGGRRVVHGIFRDLTEQRQAELVRKDLTNYQEALAVIRAHLGDPAPSDEVIADFLQVMVEEFGFLMAWYGHLEDGQVRPRLSAGKVDRYLDGLILPVSPPENPRAQCAISMALLNRRPFGYGDLMHDEGFSAWRDYALELGYRSNLALPLMVDGQVRGGIMVYDKLPHAFPEERVQYLAQLVAELGTVMSTLAERRRTEKALRIKDSAIASSINAIAIADLEGNLTYVNDSFLKLWGYGDDQEVLGRPSAEFWQLPPRASKVIDTVRQEGSWVGELVARRRDGSEFDVQLLASMVTDEAGSPICLMASFVDLTERKQAEEALREGERFLSGIFTSIQDGLSILDDNLNIVRVNPAMEQWYSHSLPLAGKKCYQAYHQRQERCEVCPSVRSLETGQPSHEVVPKRGPGGEDVGWLDLFTFPFVDQATGQVKGVIEYVRDITERYRAEARLLEETRFTEGIVDGCPVAMFVIDRDHKLVYWNRACEELTGYSREAMLGTDRQWEPWYYEKRPVMADLVVDSNLEELQRLYRDYGLALAPFVRDAYKGEGYFNKLGRHLYFLAAPVYDEQGQVLGAIETVQDVTETKALERRLQEYSRELEETIGELERKTRKLEAQEASQRAYTELLTILNSIDINHILRSSLRRIVTHANCQLGLIYLREGPEEELRLMASYSIDADALDAPMLQPSGGLPARVLQELGRVVIHDIPDDARFSFNLGFARATPRTVVGLPITFREQVLGTFIVASLGSLEAETISFLENCLRQVAVAINNALAFAQIERQSQEMADINRELAEASRLKSEFVANMSHELRTPLNSILGFSDILLKNKEGNLSQRQLGNIDKIRRNGAGLLALINSILDLSKVEAGKLEAAEEPTNIRQVIEECAESVRPLAEKNGLELVVEPMDELPIIRSDGAKMGQILVNLLSNAIKFTEEGKVSVRVRKRRRREDPIELTVEDTGIGIAAQHLEEVFKEFKQLDGAANRRYGGTGLGLSISKRLAELLGGEILVESEVGRGSSFTLRLPLSRHEAALPPPARLPSVSASATLRESLRPGRKLVLVIGADADCAQAVEQQAEELGCEVSVCGSGQDGPRRAAELAPDVIVLDLAMPDRNGWEVMGELKGKEATRDLAVVVVSGLHDRKRAYYLGAAEFVARPLEADQLRAVLARMLRPTRGRILVVDDEPEYLEVIREWLGDAVGEVCPARNGVEALRQVETRRPDAIFLDLMMPQMDGFEFLKQVRSLEGCAELPVVVVTGKQLGSDELARIQDGATSIIQKGATAQAQVMQQLERIVSRLN